MYLLPGKSGCSRSFPKEPLLQEFVASKPLRLKKLKPFYDGQGQLLGQISDLLKNPKDIMHSFAESHR